MTKTKKALIVIWIVQMIACLLAAVASVLLKEYPYVISNTILFCFGGFMLHYCSRKDF